MAYQQDPPNWQQQLSSYQTSGAGGGGGGGGNIYQNNINLLQPPMLSNTGGSIRPPSGLTSDLRARVTKLLPQQGDRQLLALNCPRCDSTNTKFCYYNNYNLAQPRHFCKTCRRYWTIGGALRNVPVGGGCRRNNKRSKGSTGNNSTSSRSKSPVNNTIGSSTTTTTTTSTTSISTSNMLGHFVPPTQQVQSSFYPSLRDLSSFGTPRDNIRLNFGGGGGGGGGVSDSSGCPIFPFGLRHEMQQYRFPSPQMQQFNFSSLGGLNQHSSGLYQQDDQIIQGEEVDQLSGFIDGTNQIIRSNAKQPMLDFGVASTNLNGMKSEENQELDDSSRNFMGVQGNNDQYWASASANANNNTNPWPDLSSFTSSFSKP